MLIRLAACADIQLKALDVGSNFEAVAELLKSALAPLTAVAGEGSLIGSLNKALSTAEDAKNNPEDYDPAESEFADSPKDLWEAIEPIFALSDDFKKFLLEHENAFKVPILSDAVEEAGKLVDKLVWSFLSILITPAINSMRAAVKLGKKDISKWDQENKQYVDVFPDDSTASDPSHSVSRLFTSSIFCMG